MFDKYLNLILGIVFLLASYFIYILKTKFPPTHKKDFWHYAPKDQIRKYNISIILFIVFGLYLLFKYFKENSF